MPMSDHLIDRRATFVLYGINNRDCSCGVDDTGPTETLKNFH